MSVLSPLRIELPTALAVALVLVLLVRWLRRQAPCDPFAEPYGDA